MILGTARQLHRPNCDGLLPTFYRRPLPLLSVPFFRSCIAFALDYFRAAMLYLLGNTKAQREHRRSGSAGGWGLGCPAHSNGRHSTKVAFLIFDQTVTTNPNQPKFSIRRGGTRKRTRPIAREEGMEGECRRFDFSTRPELTSGITVVTSPQETHVYP